MQKEKNSTSDKIAQIFEILEKQTQVLNNASWKLKKQVEEIVSKNNEIMEGHMELKHEMKDLLNSVWDEVDPMD